MVSEQSLKTETMKRKVKIVRSNGDVYKVDPEHSMLLHKGKDKLKFLLNQIMVATGIDVTQDLRKREIVYLRAIYYRLAIELTSYSYAVISKIVNRDHASVTHSMTNVWEEIEDYRPDLVEVYEKLVIDMDDEEFINLKVLKVKNQLKELEETLMNVKRELSKEYFSVQEQLTNVKKVAYNEIVE